MSKWIRMVALTMGVIYTSVIPVRAAPRNGPASDNPVRTAEQVIWNFLESWDIPGASVAIGKNGSLLYNGAFGYADASRTQPVRTENLFRVASVSKPVTAVAILKLVEQGKLSLDDKVFGENGLLHDTYYSSVIRDTRIYDITVKQLLDHTAGWDRTKAWPGFPHSDPMFYPLRVAKSERVANPVGDSTFIRFSLRKGLHFEPGERFAYSNVGYLVLGKIIEKVTGMGYESYVVSNILHPLSIYDMRLGQNLPAEKNGEVQYVTSAMKRSVYGDGREVSAPYGGFNLEAMNAHGGWVATSYDLLRFMWSVDGLQSPEDLLSAATVSIMTKPSGVYSGYGLGWQVNKNGNWWHTGSLDGTAAFVGRTAGGYTWAFLFNARADNSKRFWQALDRLPWECIAVIESSMMDDELEMPMEIGYTPPQKTSGHPVGMAGIPADKGFSKEAQLTGLVYVENSRKKVKAVV